MKTKTPKLSKNGLKINDKVCFWRGQEPGTLIKFGGKATEIHKPDGSVQYFRAALVRWSDGQEQWISSVDLFKPFCSRKRIDFGNL